MPSPTNHRPPHRGLRAAVVAGLLATTALAGTSFLGSAPAIAQANQTAPIQTTAPAPMQDFSGLVKQVKPAVVSITNKLKPQAVADEEGPQMGNGMPFPFGMMPGQPGPGMQHRGHARGAEARGSGFIISDAGIIVTNNHVVKGEESLSVTLDDGTVLPAKVIGTDPRTDLAVLKVDAGHKLPYIQLGDSKTVEPGQWVVAMGNPFGLGGSVTAGIVSARGRDIGEGPYDNFIQVDAPINQGNSGGPLFTQDGKVIGVNTAIISPSGGSVGIGFAIPSDTVRTVVQQIQAHGSVTRGFIGVEVQPVTADIATALNLGNAHDGALIASVNSDGPAAKAGLQAGDVVTAVNGDKVTSPRELALDVAAVKPDSDATLTVVHDGESKDVTVHVATLPNDKSADAGQDAGGQEGPRIGLALAPISPDVRDQLNLPKDAKGAVVAQVQPGSPAEAAGLQPGDVITSIGNKHVASPEQAATDLRGAAKANKPFALRILRNGQSAFVAVKPAESNG